MKVKNNETISFEINIELGETNGPLFDALEQITGQTTQ